MVTGQWRGVINACVSLLVAGVLKSGAYPHVHHFQA